MTNIKIINYKKDIIFLGIIVAAISILYANSLHAPFFFDGESKIEDNKEIRQISLYRLFKPYQRDKDYFERNDPMRAVTFFTFMINYSIGELNVVGYHLFNILIHVLVCAVLYFLIIKILSLSDLQGDKKLLSFMTVAFFALHPSNTETVTYIYQRSESLAALFSFLSLFAFIIFTENRKYKYLGFSVFLFIVGLFSKQTAVMTIPFIFTFYFIFIANKNLKLFLTKIYPLIPYILMLLFFQSMRFLVKDLAQTTAYFKWTTLSYISLQPYVICNYLIKTFIPFNLSAHHILDPLTSYLSLKFIIPVIIIMLFILLIGFLIWKKGSSINIKLFAVSWFFIALLPTSSFFPLTTAMADRRMYTAMPGLILFVFLCVYAKTKNYKIISVICAILIPCFAYQTCVRNQMYNEPQMLWEETAQLYKEHVGVNSRVGTFKHKQGKYDKALLEYEKGLKKDPYNISLWKSKGHIFAEQKQYKKAIECYDKIIEIEPAFGDAYKSKGHTLYLMGKQEEALTVYKKALRLFQQDIELLNNIGVIYKDSKDYKTAIAYFQKALEVDILYAKANLNIANIYLDLEDIDKAIFHFSKVLIEEPKHIMALQNLGWIYTYKKTDPKKTIKYYTKLLEVDPQNKQKKNLLADIGIAYTALKKYKKAIFYTKQAIAADPQFFEAKFNMAIMQQFIGDTDESIAMLKDLMQHYPEKDVIHIQMVSVYKKIKQHDKAVTIYNNFKNKFPKAKAQITQMENILQQKKQ